VQNNGTASDRAPALKVDSVVVVTASSTLLDNFVLYTPHKNNHNHHHHHHHHTFIGEAKAVAGESGGATSSLNTRSLSSSLACLCLGRCNGVLAGRLVPCAASLCVLLLDGASVRVRLSLHTHTIVDNDAIEMFLLFNTYLPLISLGSISNSCDFFFFNSNKPKSSY